MLVTINTDASYRHDLKLGAWAFWAKCNNFLTKKSGVFKTPCNSSSDAEYRCVINALHIMLKQPGITKVIVNTDSMVVINSASGKSKKSKSPMMKSHRQKYLEIVGDIDIEFRHVKAHNGTHDTRSYINDWCDKEANKRLKEHLNK